MFRRLPGGGRWRVRVYGTDQDGQDRTRTWFTGVTPPVLIPHEADDGTVYENAALIRDARAAAERAGSDLDRAIRQAWKSVSGPGDSRNSRNRDPDPPWLNPAATRYWHGAETVFWDITGHRRGPGPEPPPNMFVRLAASAYDHVTGGCAARRPAVIRALEQARNRIYSSWIPVPDVSPENPDA